MDPRIIVVTSGKGGVGKTTTTANLAVALAKAGYKTAAVDGDIGLRNLDVVLGLENRIVFNVVDAARGKCKIKQAAIKDRRIDGLYLFPASQSDNKDVLTPDDMIRFCKSLRKEFDYILLDCPAGIERGFENSIAPADEAVVVCTPDISSVRDADRVIGLLENKGVRDCALIVNKYDRVLIERKKQLTSDDIVDVLGAELIGVVPDDKAIIEATNRGEILALSQNTPATAAYMEIARRLEGEQTGFAALSTGRSLLSMFRRQK